MVPMYEWSGQVDGQKGSDLSLSLSLSLSLLSLHSPTLSTRCAGPTFEVYYMYIECVPSRVSVHYVYSVYVY